MFRTLRDEIGRLTGERTDYVRQKLSRTFILVFSASLSDLEEWCGNAFNPDNAMAAPLYPWLHLTKDGGDFEGLVREAVMSAFDGKRAHDLSLAGQSIVDSINQVILVADLCDRSSADRLKRGLHAAQNALNEIAGPGIPVYWTGIFVTCRPVGPQAKGDGSGPPAAQSAADPAVIRKVLNAASGRLDKVFLLDASNSQGMVLPGQRDQSCLIGQLLYFLINLPATVSDPDEFVSWLRRSPHGEGLVSGFSAVSYLMPVQSIIEAIAVARAARVMRQSLLDERHPERHSFYLNSYLQANSLVALEECKDSLSKDGADELRDPFDDLPKILPDVVDGGTDIRAVDAFDASMARMAEENAERIGVIGEKRIKQWQFSLEDHLHTMVGGEFGGLRTAERFLAALEAHLESMKPDEIRPQPYSDPRIQLSNLTHLLSTIPSGGAVVARGFIFVGASGALAASLPATLLATVGLSGIVFLGAAGIVVLAAHATRRQVENRVAALKHALRVKWSALMDHEINQAAKNRLKALIGVVAQVRNEIITARKRIAEVVDYFEKQFEPPLPQECVGWSYVVRGRDEMFQFESRCSVEEPAVADDYLREDSPLELWRRLAPLGTAEPSEWECHITERAAIRVVDQCSHIAELSVLSYLATQNRRLEACRNAMIRGLQPFLRLSPGEASGDGMAVLECESPHDQPVAQQLVDDLSRHFDTIQIVQPRSPHRLTCLSFVDGVQTKHIRFD